MRIALLRMDEHRLMASNLTRSIRRKDIMVWDVVKQIWTLPSGNITFRVGSSSRNLPLVSSLSVNSAPGPRTDNLSRFIPLQSLGYEIKK